MKLLLSPTQVEKQKEFQEFVDTWVGPEAEHYDAAEEPPVPAIIDEMRRRHYWGGLIPAEQGGAGFDLITFGLLNEEIGRGCTSLRNILTVQSMVSQALLQWGSPELRAIWLPRLGRGECLAAFALSEPSAGSDIESISTQATPVGADILLNGTKKWITWGQKADLFLVFAKLDGRPTAFLVEGDNPGLKRTPMRGLLGCRGSAIAELEFHDCRIPQTNRVGGIGFGLQAVAAFALAMGRYSVAWGCAGLIRACLEASAQYAKARQQFEHQLLDHQLIRAMLADMITAYEAAWLLCFRAGEGLRQGDGRDIHGTMVAKYFASQAAFKAAADAVQIHGANGASRAYPVGRYLRDAKLLEIIEGSSQIQQLIISKYGLKNYTR